jgi:hypothetical protein
MNKIRFNPYSNGCQGLKELKQVLRDRGHDVKELLIRGGNYRYNPNHLIINWGVPKVHQSLPALNKNSAIAANKISTLSALSPINPLFYTTDIREAKLWTRLPNKIYCRTNIYGSEGRGIVIANNIEELVEAPLYTLEIEGTLTEYRIHVFQGEVIDFAQKKRISSQRREEEGVEVNPLIRNYSNGYIFAREGVEVPDEVTSIAIESLGLLSLDFGAVDVVWNQELAYVLEFNTAPGMTNTTVVRYADAIERLLA